MVELAQLLGVVLRTWPQRKPGKDMRERWKNGIDCTAMEVVVAVSGLEVLAMDTVMLLMINILRREGDTNLRVYMIFIYLDYTLHTKI